MKLWIYIFISVCLHVGAIWFFRPRPLAIQDLTEIQVVETISSPRSASVASAPAAKISPKTKPQMGNSPSQDPSSSSENPSSPSSETDGGGETKIQAIHEGVVSEPPKVLQEKKIAYPLSARRAGVEGVVELKLVIDTEGHVQAAEIVRGPGYGLDEAALSAIKEFVFSPARIGNEKVAVRILYKYRFRLGGNG